MIALNVSRLIEACDTLQRRTQYAEGCLSSSVRAFNACMRAFDRKEGAVEAITFKVFFTAPVMQYGVATIWRDGTMAMRLGDPDDSVLEMKPAF